jgi:hypothetical protein
MYLMENRTTIQITDDLRKELRALAAKQDKSYQELLSDMITVFKELDPGRSIISIPRQLSERVNKDLVGTDMSSVSEYVTFLLRMVLAENAEYGQSDAEKIQERLRNLGYLK